MGEVEKKMQTETFDVEVQYCDPKQYMLLFIRFLCLSNNIKMYIHLLLDSIQ